MVQQQICKLLSKKGHLEFASTGDAYGKLDPKNGDSYQIVITSDNPDIQSLVTEKRLAEQACKELEKQIGYGLKIWHQFEYPDPINTADARISFVSTHFTLRFPFSSLYVVTFPLNLTVNASSLLKISQGFP